MISSFSNYTLELLYQKSSFVIFNSKKCLKSLDILEFFFHLQTKHGKFKFEFKITRINKLVNEQTFHEGLLRF